MSSPDMVIAALRTEHDILTEVVSSLSDEDLARPSGAAEWDVSEVVSHLGSGAEITQATLRAALAGEPNPGRDSMQAVWDRWNAMSRRERADGFLQANHALTALYESLDVDMRENLRVDVGFLPAPIDVATVGRMRLNELAMHSWDIRVAFDQHATLTPDATRQLLHGEPNLIGWISKPEHLDGEHAVIQVTTSDPESVFALHLDTPVSIDFDVPDEADGTLTLPAEAWLRLSVGRLTPGHTPDNVITTNAADIAVLRKVFPGY